MTYEEFNKYCGALPGTSYVMQWGGSHVWKVGGKVFAIGSWNSEKYSGITFKVSEIGFEILRDEPGLRPAPYMASRGLKWIQHYAKPGLSDVDLQEHLLLSYQIVASGLSGKKRRELGIELEQDTES